MRSLKRPLAATGAAVLLVLSLAACGDDGDEKSGDDKSTEATESTNDDASSDATAAEESTSGTADASTEDFCGGVEDIVEVSGDLEGEEPNEAEWEEIQEAYADLGEIGPPDDIPAEEREGFDVVIEAITTLSYDDAKAAFGDEDSSDDIPGVSPADNAKAEKFFAWAATACPDLAGGGPAESPTASPSVADPTVSVDPQE